MTLELERSKLLRRDAEWASLASLGRDIETILTYWTEDALVVPPDMPPLRGRNALREYVGKSFQIPGFRITWKSHEAVVSPDGRMAYAIGENALTVPGPDGSPLTLRGRAVTIWRKESDGEWRCAVDIWNGGPPE